MDRDSTESCRPATHPDDMGTIGAAQLRSAILGLLLLQGCRCQPMPTQTSQGEFSSLSPGPASPSTGVRSSFESGSSRFLLSTSDPEVPQKSSQVSSGWSKPGTPRSSTMAAHSPSALGLTWSQPQKYTSGLEASLNATPNSVTTSLRTNDDMTILPSPTSETVLTVAAFGVISFIVILVVVVIVLVGVVSLRFKCRKNKESEDPQKPGSSGLSESSSTANRENDYITLVSMKNINMNNSKGCSPAEKVL
uniref:LOW QUALITY PROTEIN: endothelial cell-specific chemotaxis regulator n=1 Tax=Jaculus jaculus TaxID=51337 RepID=UPI001E1B3D68|nr:LOW QUALITY PROTEIN: endothelial cell-specific chemotaxis regulator [Jaculus jaculus]